MRGIEFEVIWFDQDAIQYQVRCSNGLFCGAAKIYLAPDALLKTADILNGFPSRNTDSRSVQLGTFAPNAAGGGIDMSFSCLDSVGHAVVLARLRAEGCKGVGEPESTSLYIPVEAGSIDSFVIQARSISKKEGAKAYLHMADPTLDWVQRRITV